MTGANLSEYLQTETSGAFIEREGVQGFDMPVHMGMTRTPRVISPEKACG